MQCTEDSQTVTLGGLIGVASGLDDELKIFGMTVGHTIAETTPMADQPDSVTEISDGTEDGRDGECFGEAEDYELDLDFEMDEDEKMGRSPDVEVDDIKCPREELVPEIVSSKLGRLYAPDNSSELNRCKLDWALIEIQNKENLRPNLFLSSTEEETSKSTEYPEDLRLFAKDRASSKAKRKVVLMTSRKKPKRGSLSMSTSFLLVPPIQRMTKTFTLTMDPGSGK